MTSIIFPKPNNARVRQDKARFRTSSILAEGEPSTLIAPKRVEFYGRNWIFIGTKLTLCDEISQVICIPQRLLRNPRTLRSFSIAQRMSWASGRSTTRLEDKAYAVLGIVGVNMPLLYGEGFKAFIRLQEEIIKISTVKSLFAWSGTVPCNEFEHPLLTLMA